MNRLFFGLGIFFFLSLSQTAFTQWITDWSYPVAVTDSSTDNTNPVVINIEESNELLMVYEKQEDESNMKKLYMRIISDPSSMELPVFQYDEFNYSEPHLIHSYNQYYELNYFLFFLSDKSGNFEIYYSVLGETGGFSDPVNLTNTVSDEQELYIHNDSYYDPFLICWIGSGNVYSGIVNNLEGLCSLSDINLIDSVNCSSPVCNTDNWYCSVSYLKEQDTDDVQVWRRAGSLYNNTWEEPVHLSQEGKNENLVVDAYSWTGYFFWTNDSLVYLFNPNYNSIESGYFSGLTGFNSVSVFSIPIFTETQNHLVITYNGHNSEGANSIWLCETMEIVPSMDWCNEFIPFTSADAESFFFQGREVNYWGSTHHELVLLTKNRAQNHHVIYWSSRLYDIAGKIDGHPDEISCPRLEIRYSDSDCGFGIRYFSDSESQHFIRLVNSAGNIIFSSASLKMNSGWNELDLSKFPTLSPGLYFVHICSQNGRVEERFIRFD